MVWGFVVWGLWAFGGRHALGRVGEGMRVAAKALPDAVAVFGIEVGGGATPGTVVEDVPDEVVDVVVWSVVEGLDPESA
jgi:hypothetical protein